MNSQSVMNSKVQYFAKLGVRINTLWNILPAFTCEKCWTHQSEQGHILAYSNAVPCSCAVALPEWNYPERPTGMLGLFTPKIHSGCLLGQLRHSRLNKYHWVKKRNVHAWKQTGLDSHSV